jgi:hypothetical protein
MFTQGTQRSNKPTLQEICGFSHQVEHEEAALSEVLFGKEVQRQVWKEIIKRSLGRHTAICLVFFFCLAKENHVNAQIGMFVTRTLKSIMRQNRIAWDAKSFEHDTIDGASELLSACHRKSASKTSSKWNAFTLCSSSIGTSHKLSSRLSSAKCGVRLAQFLHPNCSCKFECAHCIAAVPRCALSLHNVCLPRAALYSCQRVRAVCSRDVAA